MERERGIGKEGDRDRFREKKNARGSTRERESEKRKRGDGDIRMGLTARWCERGRGRERHKKRNFWRTEKIAQHEKGATCTCLDSGMRLGFTYSYTGLHVLVRSTFSYVGTCIGRHT